MPSIELFNEKSSEYKNKIFGDKRCIFIEAGTKQSWTQFMNKEDTFIGLDSFGKSGPGEEVYEYFDITVNRVVKEANKILNINN